MALFKNKKTQGKPENAAKGAKQVSAVRDIRDVLMRPRITEKATTLAENNVYTFEIRPGTNKKQVAQAIEALYNVVPAKVNIVASKSKRVSVRGHRGVKSGVKKAYVYLKEGDRIELV